MGAERRIDFVAVPEAAVANGSSNGHVNGHKSDGQIPVISLSSEMTSPKNTQGSLSFAEAFSGQNLKDYLAIFEKDFGVNVHTIGHTNSRGEHDYSVYQVDFQPGALIRVTPHGTDASATYGTIIKLNLKNLDKPGGEIFLGNSSNQIVAHHSLDEAAFREVEGEDGALKTIEFIIPSSEKDKPAMVVALTKQEVNKRNKKGDVSSRKQVLFTREGPAV